MSERALGQTAKQAVLFLRQFHRDVQALIHSLDEALGKAHWNTAMGGRVSSDLSNGLNAERWVLNSVTRIYVPKAQAECKILAVSIELAPNAMDESVLLCASVRYSVFVDPRQDVWPRWASSDAVIAYLAANPGPQDLGRGLLDDGFMPGAASARGFIVPLCTLTSADALHDKVVKPALSMAGNAES